LGKPVLSCDADGVCINYFGRFIEYFNALHGTFHRAEDCTDHNIHVGLNLGLDKIQKIINSDEHRYEVLSKAEPVDGFVEHMKQIQKEFEVVIVTARRKNIDEPTKEWFMQHGFDFEIIHAIGSGNQFGTQTGKAKYQIAEELGAMFHIDDNAPEIERWASSKVAPICYSQPWNARLIDSHPHIHRVEWPKATEILLSSI
jgi:uncharacterized HAD superfamily protein